MILECTNCHRAYVEKARSLAGGAFNSNIVDFRDMPMGSVQIQWTGLTGALDGLLVLHASNIPEDPWFDGCAIDGAIYELNAASGTRMWIRDRLAFRYLQARFIPQGVTGGSLTIVALGKKS